MIRISAGLRKRGEDETGQELRERAGGATAETDPQGLPSMNQRSNRYNATALLLGLPLLGLPLLGPPLLGLPLLGLPLLGPPLLGLPLLGLPLLGPPLLGLPLLGLPLLGLLLWDDHTNRPQGPPTQPELTCSIFSSLTHLS